MRSTRWAPTSASVRRARRARPAAYGGLGHRHTAWFRGVTPLHGTDIEIPDLRAGFSHVIAALIADGRTTLRNVRLIERGYEGFLEKLETLGAHIVAAG